MTVSLTELEYAVCDVIQIAKQIPELVETRLAVVGGLALWHYLPDHRPTCDINFVVDFGSVDLLETMLLEHHHSPFTCNDKQGLLYHSPAGRDIQVKISQQSLFPYLADSTHFIHEIPYGEVPYVTLKGLLLTKLNASWAKSTAPARRKRDAADALALVSHVIPAGLLLDGDGYPAAVAGAGSPGGGSSSSSSSSWEVPPSPNPAPLLSPEQEEYIREALRDVSHTFFSAIQTPTDEKPPAFPRYYRETMKMTGGCVSSQRY